MNKLRLVICLPFFLLHTACDFNVITNIPPILHPIDNITVTAGETVSFSPIATDPDSTNLTFTYRGWMTSSSYTTTENDIGAHTVKVTVSDGESSTSQNVVVTVNEVPANNISVSWNANTEADFDGYHLYHGTNQSSLDDVYPIPKDKTTYDYQIKAGDGPDHYFAISAYDTAGNESQQSDIIHVNTNTTP
jgi:hypothetical protein